MRYEPRLFGCADPRLAAVVVVLASACVAFALDPPPRLDAVFISIDTAQELLLTSTEDAGAVASDEFFKDAGGTDTDWIDAAFQLLLGRPADQGGQVFWNSRLAADVSRQQAALEIANSHENNSNLINADYLHYLGRPAEQGGLDYWLAQFAAGQTNEDVIAGFTGSGKYYKEHTA